MRSHASIIDAAGGSAKFAETLSLNLHTVRSWRQRGRIPAQYWGVLASKGVATLEELAGVSGKRKAAA